MMSFDVELHSRTRSKETYLDATSPAHLTAPRGLALVDHGGFTELAGLYHKISGSELECRILETMILDHGEVTRNVDKMDVQTADL